MSSITINVERTITFPTVIDASEDFITLFLNVLATQSLNKIDSINSYLVEISQKYNDNPTRFYFKSIDNSIDNKIEYDLYVYTWEINSINTNIIFKPIVYHLNVSKNLVDNTSYISVTNDNYDPATTSHSTQVNVQTYQDINEFYLSQVNSIGLEIITTKFTI